MKTWQFVTLVVLNLLVWAYFSGGRNRSGYESGPGDAPAGRSGPPKRRAVPSLSQEEWAKRVTQNTPQISESERQQIDATVEQKLSARKALLEESQELFHVSMDPASSEDEIQKAADHFLKLRDRFRERFQELDRELASHLTPRTRARMLTAGILDNGLGFLAGRGPAAPPPGPTSAASRPGAASQLDRSRTP
jgi:hypothetical protein